MLRVDGVAIRAVPLTSPAIDAERCVGVDAWCSTETLQGPGLVQRRRVRPIEAARGAMLDGQPLTVTPTRPEYRPDPDRLQWHLKNRFQT